MPRTEQPTHPQTTTITEAMALLAGQQRIKTDLHRRGLFGMPGRIIGTLSYEPLPQTDATTTGKLHIEFNGRRKTYTIQDVKYASAYFPNLHDRRVYEGTNPDQAPVMISDVSSEGNVFPTVLVKSSTLSEYRAPKTQHENQRVTDMQHVVSLALDIKRRRRIKHAVVSEQ